MYTNGIFLNSLISYDVVPLFNTSGLTLCKVYIELFYVEYVNNALKYDLICTNQLHKGTSENCCFKIAKLKGIAYLENLFITVHSLLRDYPFKNICITLSMYFLRQSAHLNSPHTRSLKKNTAFEDHGVIAAGSGSLHNQVLFLFMIGRKKQ